MEPGSSGARVTIFTPSKDPYTSKIELIPSFTSCTTKSFWILNDMERKSTWWAPYFNELINGPSKCDPSTSAPSLVPFVGLM